MTRSLCLSLLSLLSAGWIACPVDAAETGGQSGDINLIVRADDIGSSHAANVACIESYRKGIATSVEIMVPCPWFEEAVVMLNENPDLEVGVHLTLTSEWDGMKWGPITGLPSLTDPDGHFFPRTRASGDDAADIGFYNANPPLADVEKELRAQIELAMKKIKRVTHLSYHMGTPLCRPELVALVKRLADEYDLHSCLDGDGKSEARRYGGGMGSSRDAPEKREACLIDMLNKLTPGTWIIVEHPGLDTPEMRAIGHKGYEHVAAHRQGVTRIFTSEKVKAAIKKRGIKLVDHCHGKCDLKAKELRCAHLENPLGIDVAEPRLSWRLAAFDRTKQGLHQTAYQVLVASSQALLAEDKGDLWDSGIVKTDRSMFATYQGKPLASDMTCHWKVRVRDQGGLWSRWSRPARWTMGKMK